MSGNCILLLLKKKVSLKNGSLRSSLIPHSESKEIEFQDKWPLLWWSIIEPVHHLYSETLTETREQINGTNLTSRSLPLNHGTTQQTQGAPQQPNKMDMKCPSLISDSTPLDQYLIKSPANRPTFSTDKIYQKDASSCASSGLLFAWDILKKTETSRTCFEANLQKVQRDFHKNEIYSIVDSLYQSSPTAARYNIRKKVDRCISAMSQDLKKELSELECMETMLTKTGDGKGPKKGLGKAVGLVMSAGRTRAPTQKPQQTGLRGKENKNVTTAKRPASKPFYKDEEYLTKVYGKAAYQNRRRTTLRDPYLHIQNSARQKTPRPTATVVTKGLEKKSAKTQTKISAPGQFANGSQYYFSTDGSKQRENVSGPMLGQLGPMAIPLREPRLDPGLTMPVTITAAKALTTDPGAQPVLTAPSNISMVTINSVKVEEKKQSKLTKQVLHSIDIQNADKPPLQLAGVHDREKQQGESTNKVKFQTVQYSDENLDEDDEDTIEQRSDVDAEQSSVDELPEPELVLPGHKPQPQPCHKPAFPPQPALPHNQRLSSNILVEDFVRENLMENNAVEWIEQELMAQIISEHYLQSVPAQVTDPTATSQQESICTDSTQKSDSVSTEVNIIGKRGLQLFIDAGQPVDPQLIHQIIHEVLAEKVANMLGQREEKMIEKSAQEPNFSKIHEQFGVNKIQVETVRTPQPTPKHSPLTSPERLMSPPVTPPISPEPRSLIYTKPQDRVLEPPMEQQDLYHQDSVKDSISEYIKDELTKIADIQEGPVLFEEAVEENKEFFTPDITPPGSPARPDSPTTPTLSLAPVVSPATLHGEAEIFPDTKPEAPSPQPWGNPSSPLPEENPSYTEERSFKLPQPTSAVSLETKEVEHKLITDESNRLELNSRLSSVTDSVFISDSITQTINESVSAGQWLLSKSEGQAAHFPINHTAYHQVLADISSASTLKDTEDLLQDEMNEISHSEGELVMNGPFHPEKDPVLEIVVQTHDMLVSGPVHLFPQPDVKQSMGELCFVGQEFNVPTTTTSESGISPERNAALCHAGHPTLENYNEFTFHHHQQQYVSEDNPGRSGARVIQVLSSAKDQQGALSHEGSEKAKTNVLTIPTTTSQLSSNRKEKETDRLTNSADTQGHPTDFWGNSLSSTKPGSLKMSVTIPAAGRDTDDDDVSEISLGDE